MEIRVKCSCGKGNYPKWAIVETQGVVEVQPAFNDQLQNLQIGLLCRPSSQENYTLKVGYPELIGSKVALKKPPLVLTKRLDRDHNGDLVNSSTVELEVIGIIRQRILFKTRPKALISRFMEWKNKPEHQLQRRLEAELYRAGNSVLLKGLPVMFRFHPFGVLKQKSGI